MSSPPNPHLAEALIRIYGVFAAYNIALACYNASKCDQFKDDWRLCVAELTELIARRN